MKKSLSLLLAVAMVFSMFAGLALADTADDLAKLRAAGIIIGGTSGESMDDATWLRENVAVLLSRLYGVAEEAEAAGNTHGFSDVANPYYDGFISWAKEEGIMQGRAGLEAGTFGYGDSVTAQEFATVILRALGIENEDGSDVYGNAIALAVAAGLLPEGTEASAEITRGETYTSIVAALDYEVEEGVTLGASLGLVGWVPDIGDLAITSVAPTDLKEVTVKFNQAVPNADDLEFAIKRGAATYSSTVKWNDADDTAVLTAVINLPAADYTLEITGLADETVVKEFSVLAEAVAGIEIVSKVVALENGSKITFKVLNQYGKDHSSNVDADDLGAKSVYNVTQGKTVTPASENNKSHIVLNNLVDGGGDPDEAKIGDVLRVTLSHQGFTAQENVEVVEKNINDVISLGSVILEEDDLRLNVSDGKVQLDYTLLDQYGETAKLTANSANDTQINDADGVQFASSNANVINGFETDKDGNLILTIAGSGDAIITAIINRSGVIASTTVTVEPDARPEAAVINVPTHIVAAGDKEFDLALVVTNQFGDVIDSNADITAQTSLGNVAISAKADKITVDLSGETITEAAGTTEVTVDVLRGATKIGTVKFNAEPNAEVLEVTSLNFPTVFELHATQTVGNSQVKFVDQYGRSDAIEPTITVTSSTYNVVISGANNVINADVVGTSKLTVDVDGVTKDVDVEVIAPDGIKSYTVSEIGTVYKSDKAKYQKAVKINGVDENGNAVKLASDSPEFVTSSDTSIANVSGSSVIGAKAGTATITAWKDGKAVATGTVTVSDAAPVAQSVKWLSTTDLVGKNIQDVIEVKDQYGVNIAEDITLFFSGATVTLDADKDITAVTVTAGDGKVTVVTSNGLSAKSETAVTP